MKPMWWPVKRSKYLNIKWKNGLSLQPKGICQGKENKTHPLKKSKYQNDKNDEYRKLKRKNGSNFLHM